MKTCTVCKTDKDLSYFPKDRSKKSGYKASCKACEAERARAYRLADPEKSRDIATRYRKRNANKERQRYTKYNKLNPEVRARNSAERRAKQKGATPPWLTQEHQEQIKLLYSHARECEMLTGDKYHVDHITPLNGEDVSGLHVPWNLQVLPADINIAKSNKH